MHEDLRPQDWEGWHNPSLALGGKATDIEGLEMFSLCSVGIDIGSSTTHLAFSSLILRREGVAYSAQFKVTERKILYKSPIALTPYLAKHLIDTDKVKAIIHAAYQEAGLTPRDIDTGSVIITGEALKKENSRPIVEFFAKESGKFICVSAGPNHEALLAAYGSGAVALSEAKKTIVMNIDVGGGTSKLAVIKQGIVTQTAAINVGARLITFDQGGTIIRIDDAGRDIMEELGHPVAIGNKLSEQGKEDLAAFMADVLFEAMRGAPLSSHAEKLMITEPLNNNTLEQIDCFVFSGGVSEYIYGHKEVSYGDVGLIFGKKIRNNYFKKIKKAALLQKPKEGIRATVIGAGEYTLQASGTTSYMSTMNCLPAFGLKVVHCLISKDHSAEEVQHTVDKALRKLDIPRFTEGLAFSLSLDGLPDYHYLKRVALGIAGTVINSGNQSAPLFLILKTDVAKSLGSILKKELNVSQDLIAVDGIEVGDLDTIDIGQPLGKTDVIPVTVKSLIFPQGATLSTFN